MQGKFKLQFSHHSFFSEKREVNFKVDFCILLQELLADSPRSIQLREHIRLAKLNGVELSPQTKTYFDRLNKETIEARMRFKENVTQSNARFKHLVIDEKHLGEMSLTELTAIAKDK